jgi:hypothetical protein
VWASLAGQAVLDSLYDSDFDHKVKEQGFVKQEAKMLQHDALVEGEQDMQVIAINFDNI